MKNGMGEFPNKATQFSSDRQPEVPGGVYKKGSKHISTWIQELLNDENFEARILDAKIGIKDYKGAPLKAIIDVAVVKALNGDKQWADWLANNGWKQQLDITTNGKDLPSPILGGASVRTNDSPTEATGAQEKN